MYLSGRSRQFHFFNLHDLSIMECFLLERQEYATNKGVEACETHLFSPSLTDFLHPLASQIYFQASPYLFLLSLH